MVSSGGNPQHQEEEDEWDPFADPADTEPAKQSEDVIRLQDVVSRLFTEKQKGSTWDPFADPTELEEEREQRARAEEAKAKAERDAFGREVELEAEILARSQQEQGEEAAIRGVAVTVKCPLAKGERMDAFFGDAFKTVTSSLDGVLVGSADNPVMQQALDARWSPVLALMQELMHLFVHPHAVVHFQAFVDSFALPQVGLQDIAGEILKESSSSPPERLAEVFGLLNEVLKELLKCTRRVVESLVTSSEELSKDCFRSLWTVSEALELNPLEVVFPDVGEDAIGLALRPGDGSSTVIPIFARHDLTGEELKNLLVHRLGQPRHMELFHEAGSGATHPLPMRERLGPATQHILVQGMVEIRRDDSAGKRLQHPVLKITTKSGTRMLYELRSKYQEPDFYQEYHDLRRAVKPGGEALHISKALSVQSLILPKFGFDGTLRGVMEMRTQVSFLAEFDGALMKALKDIHKLLDAHQDLPKMPLVKVIEAPRFALENTSAWVEHLANEGFVVLASVVDAEQVTIAYDLLWDFLEQADAGSLVQRRDVNTWGSGKEGGHGWAGAADDGIIQGRGIGQSEVLWYLRGQPPVRKAFAELWGTDSLVSSFDGAGVFRPYGIHRDWKITKKNWYHLDQAHYKQGLHCVQGLVTLKDATEETGGLVVVPRSHRFHNDICNQYKVGDLTSDFLSINVNDKVLTEGKLGPRMVAAKAGDLILWDSRTVHCNTAPLKENRELLEGNDLIRAVCYICMTPAAWCSDETLRRRQQGFKEGVTTAHWPHEYHPKNAPRGFRPNIILSEEQQRLIGLSRKDVNGEHAASCVKPGMISFLPLRQLRVLSESVSLRKSPTTEWGATVGELSRGEVVKGYPMGEWVRLVSWPPGAGRPHASRLLNEEVWACMGDTRVGDCFFELCTAPDAGGN